MPIKEISSISLEKDENPLDKFRFNSQGFMLISNTPLTEVITITSGKGKQPSSILSDEVCGELPFPYLFPNEKSGYSINGDVKLSHVKYFNQRMLNYTQLFPSDPDNILYTL